MQCTLYSLLTDGLSSRSVELQCDLRQYLTSLGITILPLLEVSFLRHMQAPVFSRDADVCQYITDIALLPLLKPRVDITSEIECLIFVASAITQSLNGVKFPQYLMVATATLPLYLLRNTCHPAELQARKEKPFSAFL